MKKKYHSNSARLITTAKKCHTEAVTSYRDRACECWVATAEQLKETVHLTANCVGYLLHKHRHKYSKQNTFLQVRQKILQTDTDREIN